VLAVHYFLGSDANGEGTLESSRSYSNAVADATTSLFEVNVNLRASLMKDWSLGGPWFSLGLRMGRQG